jgi:hypothetical protein
MDAHTTYEKIGIVSKAIIYISGLSIGIALLIGGIIFGMLSFFSI